MFNSQSIHAIMKECENLSLEDKIILSSTIGKITRSTQGINIHELHAFSDCTDCMWIYIIVQQQGKTSIKHRISIDYSDLKNIDKYVIESVEETARKLKISLKDLKYSIDLIRK